MGIDVDAFGQPLICTLNVPIVGPNSMEPGQGRGDNPAVIGGMHASNFENLSGLKQKFLQLSGEGTKRFHLVALEKLIDGSKAVDDKRRVRRGVEIRRTQVDRTVLVLEAEQHIRSGLEGPPNSIRSMVTRMLIEVRDREGLDERGRTIRSGDLVVIYNGSVNVTPFVLNLSV